MMKSVGMYPSSANSMGTWEKEDRTVSGFLLSALLWSSSGSLVVNELTRKHQVRGRGNYDNERRLGHESLCLSEIGACERVQPLPQGQAGARL